MKQQYRSVCFWGTELIEKNKKQSVIKWNTADHSTTVTKPAQSTVPVITSANPRTLIDNWPHTHRHLVLPVTWPVAQSTVPVINKRQPQDSNRQLTPSTLSPSELPGLYSPLSLWTSAHQSSIIDNWPLVQPAHVSPQPIPTLRANAPIIVLYTPWPPISQPPSPATYPAR